MDLHTSRVGEVLPLKTIPLHSKIPTSSSSLLLDPLSISFSLSRSLGCGGCRWYVRRRRWEAGLAEFRGLSAVAAGGGADWYRRRKRSRKRVAKVRDRFMDFWQKLVFPVRRVWLSLSARVKSPKNGAGLLKLHDDIETCGYQDVKIMWEMLQRSESEQVNQQPNSKRKRQFWRVLVWSSASHSTTSSSSSSSSPSKIG